MTEFKVNDHVRILETWLSKTGATGKIKEVGRKGTFPIAVDFGNNEVGLFKASELELVGTPNTNNQSLVGKRVRMTRTFHREPQTWVGTVKSVSDELNPAFHLKEDETMRSIFFSVGNHEGYTDTFEVLPDPFVFPTGKFALIRNQLGHVFVHTKDKMWKSLRSNISYSERSFVASNDTLTVIFEGES